MTVFYIGKKHAYRDEVTFARAESAIDLASAPRAEAIDDRAKLLFEVHWDAEDHYTTDEVAVYKMVQAHPESNVRVMSVA